MTFCLFVAVKFEVKSPFRACGSGGLANSLGGANCVPYTRSASVVPRPSPMASSPSLQYARPASRRLQYGYRKRREAERGPGKEASSACCECLPEQQAGSSLLFTSVVFYKSTALLYGRQQNGQQVANKSKEMRRCQCVVAIL